MRSRIILTLSFFLMLAGKNFAQDTLAKSVKDLTKDVAVLKKMKVTGYVQAQFQIADSNGIASYAGGNFASNVDKRFMIRRGRVKFTYEASPLAKYVLELNATETGANLIEIYGKVTEPWMKSFSLTMGVMNRPFGWEIGYTSGLRETPERGRMSQIIMPNERDLGAMLSFQHPKFSMLKIEGGMYNGTGRTSADFDYYKDFIGQIELGKKSHGDSISWSIGASYYNGHVRQATKFVFDHIGVLSNNETGFIIDSSSSNIGQGARRIYYGADAQFTYPLPFGLTTIRAEYIMGTQPGTSSSSTSPSTAPTGDTYLRNFNGAYFYFIQNIWKTKHQLVVKYDWYDPNTDISSGDLKDASVTHLSSADVKYTTIGLGWIYYWDKNVKFMFYYDMVTNETSANLAGYHKDIKDNVFTVRMQYRF